MLTPHPSAVTPCQRSKWVSVLLSKSNPSRFSLSPSLRAVSWSPKREPSLSSCPASPRRVSICIFWVSANSSSLFLMAVISCWCRSCVNLENKRAHQFNDLRQLIFMSKPLHCGTGKVCTYYMGFLIFHYLSQNILSYSTLIKWFSMVLVGTLTKLV